ncbi:MAG: hypothetical protein PF795_11640 [Kiritimatiellae bacterium]|jgi:hypothetical protein|nr:hypothetical protein [Kiritimatiellia bacterium]
MKTPPTTRRVHLNTLEHVNRQILLQTECNIRHFARHPDRIDARLSELDEEWDIERVLAANASSLALGGILLSLFNKRFLFLSAAVLAFLHHHALEGWCPPLPILRRLGVRTRTEIEYERYALKLLRGDFVGTSKGGKRIVEKVLDATLPGSLSMSA